MRFTRALALRHFTLYGPETYEQTEDVGNPIGRIAFLVFAFCIGLLLMYRVYGALQMGDFSAFYCGGDAVRNHLDPYQIASLHDCENRVVGVFHHSLFPGQTIPAPFPPVVLALFALLAFLPPGPACFVWMGITALSYGIMVFTMRRLSEISTFAIVAITAIPLMLIAFPMGQLTLLVFALLVVAAHAWRSGHSRYAALCVLGTSISPSIGIPAYCVLMLYDRTARVPLLVGALLLALIDVTVMPWSATLYYVQTLLPAHTYAELSQDQQYSLSHLLSVFNVAPTIAMRAGALDYFGMIVIGLVLAARLAKNPRQRDLALLAVPTAAMLGGSFVHIQELAIASCTALLVYRDALMYTPIASLGRKAIFGCMVGLALPIMSLASLEDLILYMGMIALLALTLFEVSTKQICIFLAGVCFVLDGAVQLLTMRTSHVIPVDQMSGILQNAVSHGQSLEDVWRLYIDNHLAWQGWVSIVLQLPALLSVGLLLLVIASFAGYVRLPRLRNRVASDA